MQCSLSGRREFYSVIFHKPSQITDLEGNILLTPELRVAATKYSYASESEEGAVEIFGTIFAYVSILLIIISLGLALFQSNGLNAFWSFLHLTQMLSLLPIVSTPIPSNFLIFITEYLCITRIAIPFSSLPDWVPNPSKLFLKFSTPPLNDRYELCGYDTTSFLFNFAEDFLMWIFLLLCFGVIRLLMKFISRKSCNLIYKWNEYFQYSCVIRVFFESYLTLNFSAIVTLKHLPLNSVFSAISYFSAALALYLSSSLFLKCSYLVEVQEFNCEYFKQHYVILTEEIRTNTLCRRNFYPLFMARRFLYVCILVLLTDYPELQIFLIIFFAIVPMIQYFLQIFPFQKKIDNILNAIFECLLFSCFSFLLFINFFCLNDFIVNILGWIMIGGVTATLIITFVLMIPGVIKATKSLCEFKKKTRIVVPILYSENALKTETKSSQHLHCLQVRVLTFDFI